MTTATEWRDLANEAGTDRVNAVSEEDFIRMLGVDDPAALREFCEFDAQQSMAIIDVSVAAGLPRRATVQAMLATHMDLGVQLGLWLAQTGRLSR